MIPVLVVLLLLWLVANVAFVIGLAWNARAYERGFDDALDRFYQLGVKHEREGFVVIEPADVVDIETFRKAFR